MPEAWLVLIRGVDKLLLTRSNFLGFKKKKSTVILKKLKVKKYLKCIYLIYVHK